MTSERLKAAFKKFDKDNSNAINKDEVKAMLGASSNIPQSVIENMIKEFDKNQDGKIQFDEFCDMMLKC